METRSRMVCSKDWSDCVMIQIADVLADERLPLHYQGDVFFRSAPTASSGRSIGSLATAPGA